MTESKLPQFLYCYCCHQAYVRGKFTCCAPPSGMASHRWLEQFCTVEVSAGKFCRRCPRCGCEHRTKPVVTGREIGMTGPGDILPTTRQEIVDHFKKHDPTLTTRPDKREWMPYRDPGEEG